MKKINKHWERIKKMSNDEELVFGADEEPVNNETESSSVEDAAASDKAAAEKSFETIRGQVEDYVN